MSYGLENPSLHPLHFGCHAGELRSGLSGWMYGTAEVLELLTFWKRGTAGGSPFSNLASSSPKDLWEDSEKIRAFLKELLYNEKL